MSSSSLRPQPAPMMRADPDSSDSYGPGERLFALGLIVWVALLGADRVDFLGGQAGFVLTPFLVITPCLLAGEGLRLLSLRVRWRPVGLMAKRYSALLMALLCVVILSGALGQDVPTSAKRSMHLLVISCSTLLVAITFRGRPWLGTALARGAELGLVLALVFNLGQLWALTADGATSLDLGFASVGLEAGRYAGIVPRLSGQVGDPNRAGLILLFYLFVLALYGQPGTRRRVSLVVGTALILLTLSRSATLSGAVVFAVWVLVRAQVRLSRQAVMAGTLVIVVVSALALASPSGREATVQVLSPLSGRLSLTEGSAEDHAYLLQRGLKEGTHSVRRAALGVGYGNSFRILQDVFPGNKYGNFHSLYLTFWVESGVAALLVVLLILMGPILYTGPFLPMVAGLWVFNVFYQSSAEPTFWLILAMAWVSSVPREELWLSAG